MLSSLPFYILDYQNFLAAIHDPDLSDNESKCLKDILSDISDKKFYDNLNTENISLDNFNNIFCRQKHDLRFLHINIHSLNSKLDEFLHLINSLDITFDVICLTEIWSTNVNFFSCILPDYEFNYDLPKSGIVGGMGVFTHKSLKIKIRNDLYIKSTSNNTIENIWMVVSKSNKKFVIGCLYRHPNSFISEFCQLMDIAMSKLNKSKHPCICLGDTNVDLLKFNVSSAVRDYIDCLISNNFLPTLLLPTRVTRSSSTLIDHISFFDPGQSVGNKIHSGSIICDISDHYPNFFLISIDHYIDMSKRPCIRIFSPSNKMKFIEKIRLYRNWILTSDDRDKSLYILQKKLYQKQCKNTKINYYKNLLSVKISSTKKIWESLNSFLGNKGNPHKCNDIEKLFYNNTIYDNKLDIANILNQYFVNVGATLANNLPSVAIDFKSFLGPSIQNSIFVDQITTTEVCNVIHSMAGGTDAGDD